MVTNDERHEGRRVPLRLRLALFLLGVLALALVLLVPGLLNGLRTEYGSPLLRPDCTVETSEGRVGLDRDEAQLATTVVALQARGLQAPDTPSSI